jgi:hypothetical protein
VRAWEEGSNEAVQETRSAMIGSCSHITFCSSESDFKTVFPYFTVIAQACSNRSGESCVLQYRTCCPATVAVAAWVPPPHPHRRRRRRARRDHCLEKVDKAFEINRMSEMIHEDTRRYVQVGSLRVKSPLPPPDPDPRMSAIAPTLHNERRVLGASPSTRAIFPRY